MELVLAVEEEGEINIDALTGVGYDDDALTTGEVVRLIRGEYGGGDPRRERGHDKRSVELNGDLKENVADVDFSEDAVEGE